MKAIVCEGYCSPDFLKLREVEKPVPKDDEVLIKVHATSINSWDWEILQGTPFVNRLMFGVFKPKKNTILGCDIAGVIEAIGKNVKDFKAGDEVFGDLSHSGWGGLAEYVSAKETSLFLKPDSVTFEQAASLPQASLLALQGLYDKVEVKAGQKILINGAGGGAGTFAIQIAKHLGAEVTGVDSNYKLDKILSLGADFCIDYIKDDFTKNGECYDVILDYQAFHSIFDYKGSLSEKGTFIFVGGSNSLFAKVVFLAPFITIHSNKKFTVLMHKANKGIDKMMDLVEKGIVIPVIDKTFPLKETAQAFRYFGEGQFKGKIVVTMEE